MKALLRNGLTKEVDIAGCVRGLRIKSVTLDCDDLGKLLNIRDPNDIVKKLVTLSECMRLPPRMPVPIDEENRKLMLAGEDYLCKMTRGQVEFS